MRAPPMRQPTAAPAMAPVLDCGPGVGVEVVLAAELETVEDADEAGCGGAEVGEVGEASEELGDSPDVELLEIMEVGWGGSWIPGIVVSVPAW